jgi:hypothetical protein
MVSTESFSRLAAGMFAQFIAAEQERWKKVLLRAKVKPD